mmetsp:Transcript_29938/g.26496  ORF Transcript_29938/g.26496 Transcript_29938/m.26496 type:complete len:82 (+) Transcript_29938:777-1022(+)
MFPDSNGISACQQFNTSEFVDVDNQQISEQSQNTTSQNKGRYPIENSAHQDAILDMAIAEDSKLGSYLFTAGRDGVIKCFS